MALRAINMDPCSSKLIRMGSEDKQKEHIMAPTTHDGNKGSKNIAIYIR